MKLVILESPYAGTSRFAIVRWFQRRRHIRYARACVRDSLSRGEAPIASHLLYTQDGILRDTDPRERAWGIDAGLAWGDVAQATVVYADFGLSSGMRKGIITAHNDDRPVIYRQIGRTL